jgi:ribulose-5-phosphate 4-epimerase/fuculose-1-phosphate aldolase
MSALAEPDTQSLSYDAALADTFVLACRILLAEGLSEAAFNVSCRLPGGRYLTNPVTSPSLVRADNLEVHEVSAISGPWKAHPAIYEQRPDVNAIVHVHAPYAIAFGALRQPFRPIHHYGAPFFNNLPNDDRPGQTGSADEARRIARTLGDARAMLQQAHGVIAVGVDLREAVLHALYLEEACRIYAIACQMGQPHFLTREQAEKITGQIMKPRSQNKAWEHYVDKLRFRMNPAGAETGQGAGS